MKIVLSPNPYRDRGLRAAQAAQRVLENAGASTAICLPFEVDRHYEFAPIKNMTGIDSVETARVLCQENGIEL